MFFLWILEEVIMSNNGIHQQFWYSTPGVTTWKQLQVDSSVTGLHNSTQAATGFALTNSPGAATCGEVGKFINPFIIDQNAHAKLITPQVPNGGCFMASNPKPVNKTAPMGFIAPPNTGFTTVPQNSGFSSTPQNYGFINIAIIGDVYSPYIPSNYASITNGIAPQNNRFINTPPNTGYIAPTSGLMPKASAGYVNYMTTKLSSATGSNITGLNTGYSNSGLNQTSAFLSDVPSCSSSGVFFKKEAEAVSFMVPGVITNSVNIKESNSPSDLTIEKNTSMVSKYENNPTPNCLFAPQNSENGPTILPKFDNNPIPASNIAPQNTGIKTEFERDRALNLGNKDITADLNIVQRSSVNTLLNSSHASSGSINLGNNYLNKHFSNVCDPSQHNNPSSMVASMNIKDPNFEDLLKKMGLSDAKVICTPVVPSAKTVKLSKAQINSTDKANKFSTMGLISSVDRIDGNTGEKKRALTRHCQQRSYVEYFGLDSASSDCEVTEVSSNEGELDFLSNGSEDSFNEIELPRTSKKKGTNFNAINNDSVNSKVSQNATIATSINTNTVPVSNVTLQSSGSNRFPVDNYVDPFTVGNPGSENLRSNCAPAIVSNASNCNVSSNQHKTSAEQSRKIKPKLDEPDNPSNGKLSSAADSLEDEDSSNEITLRRAIKESGKSISFKEFRETIIEMDYNMDGKYHCNFCSHISNSMFNLLRHERINHRRSPSGYSCSACDMSFREKNKLIKHFYSHSRRYPYRCRLCNYGASTYLLVQWHVVTYHLGVKPFQCKICGLRFTTRVSLKIHKNTHSGKLQFLCDICGKEYFSQKLLTEHAFKHKERLFKCNECGGSFYSKTRLNNHITRSHSKRILCEVCGILCKEHCYKNSHNHDVEFKCDHCGKTFKTKVLLATHSRIHTKEKFICKDCGLGFTHISALIRHKQTVHEGARSFKCDICEKTFTQCNSLTRHKRIHTGERPFACEVCGKRFIERYPLTVHMKKHEGEAENDH